MFVPSQNDGFASGTVIAHSVNSVAVISQVEKVYFVSTLIWCSPLKCGRGLKTQERKLN